MTRETKMGLLVGLAFVLIFGILVSNHLSTTNEPLGAPLREAADTLRSGLGQPGNDDVAPVLRAPQAISPQQPVVTNEELNRRAAVPPPVRFVAPTMPMPGQAITFKSDTNSAPGLDSPGGSALDRLRGFAQQRGEQLVPDNTLVVNNSANNTPPTEPVAKLDPDLTGKPVARSYEAVAGDSLSTIAMKAYGSGKKAYRELIVAANPDLASNRDLIVAGRSYTIPALVNGTVTVPNLAPAKPTAPVAVSKTYTVKSHDTLWSIAIAEVGSPSAIAAIKDLNKDVLNGSDGVRPNMKLVLPAKKTAE